MTDELEELEELWRGEESSIESTALKRTVRRQTYTWFFVLIVEMIGLLIGIVVPLLKVISTPSVFWFVWALDIWSVVGIAGWFVVSRARHLMLETDQTTEEYVQLLTTRYRHQIAASRAGIFLGALQFFILPLLMWWQMQIMDVELEILAGTYGSVLLVMAIYIAALLRVVRNARTKMTRLAADRASG